MQFKSDGVTKSGVKYNNEYIATFYFDGEKIIRLKEFVDSKHITDFLGAIAFA
jgi:ketosteroid isomerase-like protein